MLIHCTISGELHSRVVHRKLDSLRADALISAEKQEHQLIYLCYVRDSLQGVHTHTHAHTLDRKSVV